MSRWELSNSYDYQVREVRYGWLGEGPSMVLIHGTPWSSFNLRHLIRKLSEEYTVYFLTCWAMVSRVRRKAMFRWACRMRFWMGC
jgi:hypothetical protein